MQTREVYVIGKNEKKGFAFVVLAKYKKCKI